MRRQYPTNFQRIGQLQTTMSMNMEQNIPGGELTVPIVGIPRGGTTMVAKVVESLGINLGPKEDLDKYTMEDQTIHSPEWEKQLRYIQKRNDEHPIWGWKDPTGISSVQRILFALRNPHIIVVFRDMLATIQGEMRFDISVNPDVTRPFNDLTEQTLNWWRDNFRFIENTKFPTLLVSYERAVINPGLFIKEVAQFLEVAITPEQTARAMSLISPTGGYAK